MLFPSDTDCWKGRHLDHSIRITIIRWSWSIVWNWCFRMWDLMSILWSEGGTIGSPPYPASIELYLAHVTRSRYMSLWKSKGALGNPTMAWINSGVGSRMFIHTICVHIYIYTCVPIYCSETSCSGRLLQLVGFILIPKRNMTICSERRPRAQKRQIQYLVPQSPIFSMCLYAFQGIGGTVKLPNPCTSQAFFFCFFFGILWNVVSWFYWWNQPNQADGRVDLLVGHPWTISILGKW